jgi:hypothetical protein
MTDSEIIDTLGGTKVVAAMFGINASAVSNWRAEGIPLRRRFRIARELQARGVPVPPDFFEDVAA